MTEDIVAIQNLLASYCHRVDRGSADEVSKLFAEDAILRPYYDGDYECHGRDAVKRWYAFYHENLGAAVKNLKHVISSSEISVHGEAGESVTYLTAYFITKEDGVAYQTIGTYFDKLKKYGKQWLFQDRRIEVEYMTQLNGVIDKMEPMGFEDNS